MLFILRLLVWHDFHFARDVVTWLLFCPYWRGIIFILHLLVPHDFILRLLSSHDFHFAPIGITCSSFCASYPGITFILRHWSEMRLLLAYCHHMIFIVRIRSCSDCRFVPTSVICFTFCAYCRHMIFIWCILAWYYFSFAPTGVTWFSFVPTIVM